MGQASKAASELITAMRTEAQGTISRSGSTPAMGFVRRIGTNMTIQVAGKELLLYTDELLFLDGYTPARGDKVLLVPMSSKLWAVIGPLVSL